MPANQRQQIAKSKSPTQTPTSPTFKATAKYTNKDGSKFITVPKSSEATETSTSNMAHTTSAMSYGQIPPTPTTTTNGVNKKKQKRREKAAARLAVEQGGQAPDNGAQLAREMQEAEASFSPNGQSEEHGQFDSADAEPYYSDEEGDAYSGSYGQNGSPPNGYSHHTSNPSGTSKSKKKKKGKSGRSQSTENSRPLTNGLNHNHSLNYNHLRNEPPSLLPRGPGISKEKIWNTSSHEERERIKAFWLALGEDERKSLVKVEKDAVLKKMKEQQKHSCSCTVCGRKRTAIEEELEVLYDAYYEELEQYANRPGDQPLMPPPSRRFGPMSGLQPPNRLPPTFNGQQPSRGRIVEQLGDDEDDEGDEEYSEDEGDEDDYSDEEPELEDNPRSYQTDFFNFGQSLTVQGGILTVADDLLKNDGKKFIEMMEQLAERRMAREEDAKEQSFYSHQTNGIHNHPHTHNHPPPAPEDEYDDEEDDDEYDSQDEDYDDEEEEMDTMTEEQRMEEGRRMFQIFAARMFEQRVLTAYKEKVAKDRQEKLLEELDEESRAESQKKAKKAMDAQKKKDKALQKKAALAEAKAKKDAEKAAEEAALRAAEEKIQKEKLQKAEEDRKKKEAQKQAKESERLKKEAEKLRKAQEARDRQAEAERKRVEAKVKKDEAAKAAKEAREREIEEKKLKQEQEKREKEAKLKSEKEAKDKEQRGELAAQQAATKSTLVTSKRPPVPLPSNLQTQPSAIVSPHVPIATPAVPKAPTPSRLRTASQQESSGSYVPQTPQTGGTSQNVSPVPSTPLQGSPGLIGPPGKAQNHQPLLHHPQATSPMHSAIKGPPGMQPNPFGMPPLNMGYQPGMPMMNPPYGAGRMPFDPIFSQPMGAQFRPMAGPNGMPIPPGMNLHQLQQGRGFPTQHPPPGFPQSPNGFGGIGQPFGQQKDSIPAQSHSRHPSATFEGASHAQPIARPAPIGRPSSVVHGQHHGENFRNEVDDLSNALGSSALIDESDEPLTGAGARRSSAAPGGIGRTNYAPAPFGMDTSYGSPITPWGGLPNPFGASSLPVSNFAGGWPQSTNTSFGSHGGSAPMRTSQPRSVAIRLMICRACKNLEGSTPDGFYDVNSIKDQVDRLNSPADLPISEKEILDICDTEGNPTNGGGYLDIRKEGNGHHSIRHELDILPPRPVGAPGEIGSPIVGGSARFGPPPGF